MLLYDQCPKARVLTTVADRNPPEHTDSLDFTQAWAQAHLLHSQIFAESLCFTPLSGYGDGKQEPQVKNVQLRVGGGGAERKQPCVGQDTELACRSRNERQNGALSIIWGQGSRGRGQGSRRRLTLTRCFLCWTLSTSSSSSLSSSSQFCRKGICSSTEPPRRSLPSLPAAFLPRQQSRQRDVSPAR